VDSSKEFLLPNEFSEANLNTYKRISNWQPFMKRVYVAMKYDSLKMTYKKLSGNMKVHVHV